MQKEDGKLILNVDKLLENMIQFNHRHVFKNNDAYIYSFLNIEALQDQHQFLINQHVEDIKSRDLVPSPVGKRAKKNHKEEAGKLGENQGLEWS